MSEVSEVNETGSVESKPESASDDWPGDALTAASAEPVPKLAHPGEVEIKQLRLDAQEAVGLVQKLKSQQADAMRLLGELDGQIRAAEMARDQAMAAYQRVVPKKLPPVPSFQEMMAMARRQRPDGDDRETVMMAARMHATLTGPLAGEGMAYDKPLPEMEGSEVRKVDDTHYDIKPPTRERKSHG